MGFLLRCCFWIGLALLFVPISTGDGSEPQVNPLQALIAARDAVADIASICERKPTVCQTASAAVQTIVARAGEGLRLAQQMIDTNAADEPAQEPDAVQEASSPADPEQHAAE